MKENQAVRLAVILLASLPICITNVAQSTIILEVDISNPSEVLFLPTSEFAELDIVGQIGDSENGIALSEFFLGNTVSTDEYVTSGSLNVSSDGSWACTPVGGRCPLGSFWVGVYQGWTLNDAAFYAEFVGPLSTWGLDFSTTETALTGSISHNLSAFLAALPVRGTVGDLLAGDPANQLIIGQWKVVPEPSASVLLGLGLLGIGYATRAKIQ